MTEKHKIIRDLRNLASVIDEDINWPSGWSNQLENIANNILHNFEEINPNEEEINEHEYPIQASKMKCPACGSKLNAGSRRFIHMTPSNPEHSEQPYVEKFWILIFYCQKSDAHTFGILKRVSDENNMEEKKRTIDGIFNSLLRRLPSRGEKKNG